MIPTKAIWRGSPSVIARIIRRAITLWFWGKGRVRRIVGRWERKDAHRSYVVLLF